MPIIDTSNRLTKDYVLSLPKVINESGCWVYQGVTDPNGYVNIYIINKNYRLHRIVAHLWHDVNLKFDDLKENFICHRCNNPSCFNPEHLYEGNPSTNMYDAVKAKTHVQSRKTHCKYGHLLDSKVRRANGKRDRTCSTCHKLALRKHRANKRLIKS